MATIGSVADVLDLPRNPGVSNTDSQQKYERIHRLFGSAVELKKQVPFPELQRECKQYKLQTVLAICKSDFCSLSEGSINGNENVI